MASLSHGVAVLHIPTVARRPLTQPTARVGLRTDLARPAHILPLPRLTQPITAASAMSSSGRGLRRSRESVQQYQQGSDEEEEGAQYADEDEGQYEEEVDDNEEEEEQQGEEEGDEDEEDEEEEEGEEGEEGDTGDDDEQQGNESVEQEEVGEDDEQYFHEHDEDDTGLNDTKELDDEQQQQQHDDDQQPADDEQTYPTTAQSAPIPSFTFTPGAPPSTAGPFSFSSSTTLPASTAPFSFTPFSSSSSATAFTSSSSTSSSSSSLGAAFGSAKGSIAPFSFSAGSSSSSSSSSAPSAAFTFPPVAASSASSSSFSLPSTFAVPSTSSSSSAPSSSLSFSSVSQPRPTFTAPAPSIPSSAASTSQPSSSAAFVAPSTSAAVSTTAAGTTIRVPLSTSSISAVWSPSDDLLFYPSNPAPSSRNNQPTNPPAPSHLSLFRWPPVYGETSTLLHAWHAVFASTQRQAAERVARRQRAESMEWRLVVLSQSHCYRAELEACLYRAVQSLSSTAVANELQRAAVSPTEYHAHLRILETVSSTWHLFELLYLDPHDNLTVQLTDWMQRSYLAPSLDGLAVDGDEWWEGVLGLLVQGRLVAVVEALRAAEGQLLQFVSSGAWQQLLELIETLPSLTAHASSVTQLVALVRDYRLAVQRLATSSAALMSHPFLPYLLAVLVGDEQAIATISPTWMQLLVARLIFIQPHTTKADIPQLVTHCIQQMDDKDKADAAAASQPADRAGEGGKALDALREHVLCFRVHSAVLLADQMFDMPYFTAHLVDLLHHAALMPTLQDDTDGKSAASKAAKRSNSNSNTATAATQQSATADKLGSMTPRDWYVLQYVQSIIAHDRLWTLTPDYIQSLTTHAIRPVQALATLLLRQPCSTYAQLGQLQAMAGRLQLPALVGEQLALRLGHHLLRAEQVGSAVAVYQRGGAEGEERVRQIARKLLFALIKGNGDTDSAAGELTTAMECVLDNVSEEWLDDERGNPDILLLQHWADYTTITRHLHTPPPLKLKQPHSTQATPPNPFQADQASLSLPPAAEAAVPMEDGAEEGEAVGGLLQDGVALLVSLLTAPLVVGSAGGGGAAVAYTPQCFHLPLLVRLCGLLRRVEAGGVGCELSAGGVRDVLHALSRCELSWLWEDWKAEAGVSGADVMAMRRTLLKWLQTTSTAEESAKRISVRV